MKITTTIKKTSPAAESWMGTGFGTVRETATYTVYANGAPVMVVDGGSYGYMESPEWNVKDLTGRTLHHGKSYREAREWALSDDGLSRWMDLNWKRN